MSDYNWKPCSDARLRELLDEGRNVIIRTLPNYVFLTVERSADWLDRWTADGREHWQFLDPDETAQMQARIEELEKDNEKYEDEFVQLNGGYDSLIVKNAKLKARIEELENLNWPGDAPEPAPELEEEK